MKLMTYVSMKKLFKFCIASIALSLAVTGHAAKPSVRLLTWWGYFHNKALKEIIEKKCHIDLQIQNYRDDIDFTRLFNQDRFNLVIFESTKLPIIRQKLTVVGKTHLSRVSKDYPPFIRNKLHEQSQSDNVAFFVLSDISFLYNPKNVMINKSDTIPSIIKKLIENKNKPNFVLLDDPNMISRFIKSDQKKTLTIKSFNSLFNYPNLIVSNDFRNYKNLGVAIIWSGEAFLQQTKAEQLGIKLKVVRIPKYSIITADYIAQITNDNATSCAAKVLAGKSFLNKIQATSLYFSPYMTDSSIKNQSFLDMHKSFYDSGKKNQWNWYAPSKLELKNIAQAWKRITLKYGL